MIYQSHDINIVFSTQKMKLDVIVYINDLNVFVPVTILNEAIIKKSGKRINEITTVDVFDFITNNPIEFRGQQYPNGMDNIIAQATTFRNSKINNNVKIHHSTKIQSSSSK